MFYMNAFYDMPHQDYLRSRRVAIWHRSRRQVGAGLLKHLAAQVIGQVVYIEIYEILSSSKLAEYVRRINQHAPDVILAFAGTVF